MAEVLAPGKVDLEGLRVGHFTDGEARTGRTVVLAEGFPGMPAHREFVGAGESQ